jgi:hypothetical protein
MAKTQKNIKNYEDELKEYAENLENTTNFDIHDTLSPQEHKMLIEGYKSSVEVETQEYQELEIADLSDFMFWERSNGGNYC